MQRTENCVSAHPPRILLEKQHLGLEKINYWRFSALFQSEI